MAAAGRTARSTCRWRSSRSWSTRAARSTPPFTWENVEDYNTVGNRQTPVAGGRAHAQNLTEGEYWSGSPFLGGQGVLNPEVQGKNACGEYYHVAHNHNLAESTNYGAAFGGQLTLIRVDPADTTNCGNS